MIGRKKRRGIFKKTLRFHLKHNVDGFWDFFRIWLSPLFPKIDQPSIVEDSCTNFKTDFREYLKSYNLKPLDSLVEILDNYDFSEAKYVVIILSY